MPHPLGAGPGSSSGEGGWFEGAAQQFQGGGHQTNHRAHSTAQAEGEASGQGGSDAVNTCPVQGETGHAVDM